MKSKKMGSLEDAVSILRAVQPYIAAHYKMNVLGLFGSWARGREKKIAMSTFW